MIVMFLTCLCSFLLCIWIFFFNFFYAAIKNCNCLLIILLCFIGEFSSYVANLEFVWTVLHILIDWQVMYHTTLLLVPTHIGDQRLVIIFIIWYRWFLFFFFFSYSYNLSDKSFLFLHYESSLLLSRY